MIGPQLISADRYCSGGSCSDLVSAHCYLTTYPFSISQMKPGLIREEYIAIIVRELLRGLDYLHSEGKLHRDIKGLSSTFVPCLVYTQLVKPQTFY